MFALLLAIAVGAASPTPTPVPTPMVPARWEYTVVQTYGINAGETQQFMGLRSEPTARLLNAMGAQGWELVDVVREREGERVYYFFKRPLAR